MIGKKKRIDLYVCVNHDIDFISIQDLNFQL